MNSFNYKNNTVGDEKEHACSHFRTGECRHKLECRFQHKFCLNGDCCKIIDRCKYLHPSDTAFIRTCKKSWEHCPHGKACQFKQHADQDYVDNNNNDNNINEKRLDNFKKFDYTNEKVVSKNKDIQEKNKIHSDRHSNTNAEEQKNDPALISDENLKLLLKKEMDHLIIYLDQKFDVLEYKIKEKIKNTN